MTTSHHVELDAAKLLQKLIQDSKDEPAKLATKLFVICQHMKLSGKEHSLPYQVISRAMEKVINQHGLDMNVLSSSRLPLTSGPQEVDAGHGTKGKDALDNQLPTSRSDLSHGGISSGAWHGASSGLDMARHELIYPSKPLVGLGRVDSMPVDAHQGSFSHRSGKSSEQESPASVPMDDTRSANSQEIHDSIKSDNKANKKNIKKSGNKRKRADSKAASDAHSENPQQSDNISTGSNSRKGKQVSKGGLQGQLSETIASRNATSTSTNTPFNDQQLRQLRAQCLVFLAFRNNLLPRKLHLEIALGVNNTQEVPTSPPKYTTFDKWMTDYQKRKLAEEQKWFLKQKQADERITTCFAKLKENVNSSEDISAKTKSVIELKKLQLLKLQRRLRSEFLDDFFKPIASDMDRLKSIKKHRHGRRVKQLEKFEQKMKEERLKRIRERQKEFFAEIEAHREKLEDYFKVKRERWKGFNKYVKEFHKRKERIYREKIDRIQREKINLLKNNDVEGYLRMVQDAKSDRVRQLLKETEKYLQKLGSRLKEAKGMSRRFEMEVEDCRPADVDEKLSLFQHYLESNEKYYMLAHSIKESINEQPSSLVGGKLREYQMNGLRWLVSLYNNHLNGILADEMGLGKTVQVIALICYLMEKKNDRGPFLVVVPSSVLPGWASEICNWAPSINAISYSGSPEERRKLYKERIVHRKFNVLLTTYEYLMNKHDKPKLSKVQWHYIIIDEGHRIKNASCKLNADLKHYSSTHRLLLTGTPLQNNLDELWALLNFLLPNIFNSSEDFSQWFNKPFEGNVDASPDEVENELPEKIERLIRCEASAYQKLLMKRVEENLGSIGNAKGRSVHNTVMEMRNICNHPYLSQINSEEIDALLPKHYLPPVVRLCGKMEMLDRLLPKLKATDHRVLFFSTMTRLLDVMEEYLSWKRYKYLRLDGHTSGNDRGALIDEFNRPGSETFIFLLSIRAGGVGVNLQAADTVIIFDTDWNPQVDLQAQARAHRIGQKRDVLVLRFETVRTVEEHVRASAEHKLGVANQSITAGFFDNNTSAEDRREYLESLLRECKKEEAALVLDDDSLNDLLARSESEIDVFESIDKKRREEEMAAWINLVQGNKIDASKPLSMPSRLVTEDDLKPFYEAMRIYDTSIVNNVPIITKRKGQNLGGLDTEQYGRGKRAREIRSYEDQMTEEEFEKMCQVDSPESAAPADQSQGLYMAKIYNPPNLIDVVLASPQAKDSSTQPNESLQPSKEPQVKRGRGRPRRSSLHMTTSVSVPPAPFPITNKGEMEPHKEPSAVSAGSGPQSAAVNNVIANTTPQLGVTALHFYPSPSCSPIPKARGRPSNGGETSRGRGRKQKYFLSAVGAQLNAYTVIQAGVDATMSKPDANVVAEGNATMNVAVGVPNFASIDYKTGQIPGSSTVVDAPAFKASSSRLPEILDNTMSVIVEKDIGDVTTVSETESASIGTKLPVTPDQVSVLQPKNPDGVKTDSDYSTAKQTFGSSTPDAFSPKQGQAEKTVDSLQERTQKTEQNIESSLNDKHTEVGINDVNSIQMLDKTPPDLHAKSSEMLKPADENRSDICTQMNQETTPSVDVEAFNKLKSVDKSLLRNSKSTSGNSLLASHSSSVGDKAPGDESQSSVSIEAIKFQDNASITGTPMLSSTSMNHENLADPIPSCQVQDSPVLDYRADRVVIHRDSENRASVTRKKAAARETRSRCNSSTAACERRARQAGLKLADGSKKAESRGRTGKATTMKTKQESGNIEAGPGTSRFKTAQGPGISFQQIETSLEKLDPTKQGNRQIMSSEKAVTSASRNFEQTVTKEIKLDQGVTGVSAFDPNKTLSVTSKGNVETNTTSSSNMEGGLVLGLPSLREFPLPKINPLEGKSNMVLPANATIKLTDNFKNTEIDQLLEEPVTSSVTCIRPEGFSEAEVKQLTSVSKSSAPDRNTVPEILEAKITGRSLVKSDAQNSKTHPAGLILTHMLECH
ncbi:Chromatin structure-remodeling complex protein SYD [Dendrobium catenatum]|uniref:Chromatin structure-remodeling complex protein SYD n=1 Tax=Dendrobium catenatum TaxID=906689 RepID=A0A2I0WRA2_9ASPA|nr:Chromatin structure-remodeling complex protein SYD [Dendrobium catenatum]